MSVTAIEGVVENGKIRLTEDVALPENARVYVIVADAPAATIAKLRSPRLADPNQAAQFRKQVFEVSHDAKL